MGRVRRTDGLRVGAVDDKGVDDDPLPRLRVTIKVVHRVVRHLEPRSVSGAEADKSGENERTMTRSGQEEDEENGTWDTRRQGVATGTRVMKRVCDEDGARTTEA